MDDRRFKIIQYAAGGAVTLLTLIVYSLTVAPTLSYWDCGEFIACAHILGIPHPPGTPLYVLIGRVFAMLPIASDIAVRINYVSVVTSALAAGMAFFVLVRFIRNILTPNREPLEAWQALVTLGAAVSGSLFMAFSATNWNNAVEAEVYGPSMLLILALCWLALRWQDRRGTPRADRYLVAIGYLALLSLGIHMTTYLVMPVLFLFIIMVDSALRRDWRFWITGIVLFIVATDVTNFLILSGIWLVTSAGMAVTRRSAQRWGLIAAVMVASWLGYSAQLFIPIRSAQDPNIDENNPETFNSFISFLERKQYGQQSMVSRMFARRGTWANQFGDHAHMGFYRYFKQQYGFGGWLMMPVMALGFGGIWWAFRRRPPWGIFALALFFVGSAGLVLYMNFADGTQYHRLSPDAYMEVRNRDYFFTPGFIVFGMMLGLGFAGLATAAAQRLRSGKTVAVTVAVIAALLPFQTLRANWLGADRSRNFTPYDYAYDILQSCAPNAILFTGGDNDTFPLWCLQDVYGVRNDISIVNLSLANTDWYIYQMKHMWGLPVTFTDDQILWSVSEQTPAGMLMRPKEPYRDPISGNMHYLFTTRDGEDFVTTAMMITEHIIFNNKWQRPVYFSGNPGDKSRLALDRHTRMVGSVFQVVREDANFDFDYEATAAMMDSVFLFRSYDSPEIGLDDNAVGLAMVFPEKEMIIADYYRRRGDSAEADRWNRMAVETFPFYWRAYEQMARDLRAKGDSAAAGGVMQEGVEKIGGYVRALPDNRMYWFFWGKMCEAAGKDAEAEEYLSRAFYLNPYDQQVYQSLLSFLLSKQKSAEAARAALLSKQDSTGAARAALLSKQKSAEAARAARKWLEYYPNDSRARSLVTLSSSQPG